MLWSLVTYVATGAGEDVLQPFCKYRMVLFVPLLCEQYFLSIYVDNVVLASLIEKVLSLFRPKHNAFEVHYYFLDFCIVRPLFSVERVVVVTKRKQQRCIRQAMCCCIITIDLLGTPDLDINIYF